MEFNLGFKGLKQSCEDFLHVSLSVRMSRYCWSDFHELLPRVFITVDSYCFRSRIYRVIQKDGLNFVRLYFLNYTWYMNDLHNI